MEMEEQLVQTYVLCCCPVALLLQPAAEPQPLSGGARSYQEQHLGAGRRAERGTG